MTEIPTYQELKDRFPEAPAHSIYAVIFALRVRKDEGEDYPFSAATGRYMICQDIMFLDEEYLWIRKIQEALEI